MKKPTERRQPMKIKGCLIPVSITAALGLLLLCFGCNTEKRCARQMVRCGVVFTSDTQYVHDSIRIERVLRDTLLQWDSLIIGDTVTIERDRLRVKVVKLPGERLFIQGECKDTVVRYIRQVVNAVKRERFMPLWLWWLLFGGFIFGFWLRNRVPL